MWRYLAGGAAALLLVLAGMLLFKTPARSVSPLAPAPSEQAASEDEGLPDAVPEALPKTREQKRFNRYDKDRNALITRDEYLASRRKAYARLDTDGDGRLSFDEWSAKTAKKFADADADRSGTMTAKEFAATAPKRRTTTRLKCPPTATPAGGEDDS